MTIDVPLPTNYTAPPAGGETHGGGWWKIEYDMGGSSTDNATDITTWTGEPARQPRPPGHPVGARRPIALPAGDTPVDIGTGGW